MTQEREETRLEMLSRQEKVDQYITQGDYSLGGIYLDPEDQAKIKIGDYVFHVQKSIDNKVTKLFSVLSQLERGQNSTSLEQLKDHQIVALPSRIAALRKARYMIINQNPKGKYGDYKMEFDFLRQLKNGEILEIKKFIRDPRSIKKEAA